MNHCWHYFSAAYVCCHCGQRTVGTPKDPGHGKFLPYVREDYDPPSDEGCNGEPAPPPLPPPPPPPSE